MKLTIYTRQAVRFTTLVSATLAATVGCNRKNASPEDVPPGLIIEQSRMIPLQDRTAELVTSAPPKIMKGSGLAGVLGGARVKLRKDGSHELLLPMPQVTETQIPVCYAIKTTPLEAAKEYRLRLREGSNAVVTVQLNGSRDHEVRINWSSIILVVDRPVSPDPYFPETYLRKTARAQSGAKQVVLLADKLWPANGSIEGYAANIQEFIRSMKQKKQPRSMDALQILQSRCNWICTGNANLAAALLRSRSIPARSVAVIPLTSQRLEMHRIVEYFDNGRWHKFDPSSLHKEIPLNPWQNVIMARTSIADEKVAMKPRRGASLGCPYGQELEFLEGAITLWGEDFFWTIGKPIAEFEVTDESLDLARTAWNRFLAIGKLSQNQIKAASASDLPGFLEALRTR